MIGEQLRRYRLTTAESQHFSINALSASYPTRLRDESDILAAAVSVRWSLYKRGEQMHSFLGNYTRTADQKRTYLYVGVWNVESAVGVRMDRTNHVSLFLCGSYIRKS